MALLASFIRLCAPLCPANRRSYIARLILLAARLHGHGIRVELADGEPNSLTPMALNDRSWFRVSIVALLLGVSSLQVPWATLFLSVLIYILIPLVLAQVWRRALRKRGTAAFQRTLARIAPFSLTALLATIVLLFAFQGEAILRQPLVIALLAVPILSGPFNSGLAIGSIDGSCAHCVAGPSR